jgi:hypothetical protein
MTAQIREMDFSMTALIPVEQVLTMEVVIMTVPMMLQMNTTICLTVIVVEVSLHVPV